MAVSALSLALCMLGALAVSARAASPYPATTSGIHLAAAFGYHNDVVPPAKVDYIWGATTPRSVAYGEAYIPFDVDWSRRSLSWFRRHHPSWIVYQCDRKTPAWYQHERFVPLDAANTGVRKWYLSRIESLLRAGYRGIAIDNFTLTNFQHRCGVWRGKRWHQLGYGEDHAGDPRVIHDMIGWLRYLSSRLHRRHPGATLTLNSGILWEGGLRYAKRFLPYVDGTFDEGGFTAYGDRRLVGSEWLAETAWAEAAGRSGKSLFLNALMNRRSDGGVTTSDVNWALANYLLVKGDHAYMNVYANGSSYGRFKDRPEFHVAIGRALGPRYSVAGLWLRPYSGGEAIVNPSATTYAVDVSAGQSTLERRKASRVILAPGNGAVLLAGTASGSASRRNLTSVHAVESPARH